MSPLQRYGITHAARRTPRVALWLFAAMLAGCSGSKAQGEPEFFYLKSSAQEFRYPVQTAETSNQKADYVVVTALPAGPVDTALLLGYWRRAVDARRIEDSFNRYRLQFFRESEKTPRDYSPSDGYMETDDLSQHTDDLIAEIRWRRCDRAHPAGTWTLSLPADAAGRADAVLRDDCGAETKHADDSAPVQTPAR